LISKKFKEIKLDEMLKINEIVLDPDRVYSVGTPDQKDLSFNEE
jgi:hypothetical protein